MAAIRRGQASDEWGHAPTQTTDPSQRFPSLPTGTCAPLGQPGYAEYMHPRDLQRFETVAAHVVQAITDVRGRRCTATTGTGLYPTTGTLSDDAHGRHVADASLRKTDGCTLETGPQTGHVRDSFHPPDPEPITSGG